MIALETNVLIYCCDKRDPRRQKIALDEQQWAFWDATLVSACLETGVSRLYSEDLPGRTTIESLEIVSPFA